MTRLLKHTAEHAAEPFRVCRRDNSVALEIIGIGRGSISEALTDCIIIVVVTTRGGTRGEGISVCVGVIGVRDNGV